MASALSGLALPLLALLLLLSAGTTVVHSATKDGVPSFPKDGGKSRARPLLISRMERPQTTPSLLEYFFGSETEGGVPAPSTKGIAGRKSLAAGHGTAPKDKVHTKMEAFAFEVDMLSGVKGAANAAYTDWEPERYGSKVQESIRGSKSRKGASDREPETMLGSHAKTWNPKIVPRLAEDVGQSGLLEDVFFQQI